MYPLKYVDVPHMSCENEECEIKEISVVSHGSLEQKESLKNSYKIKHRIICITLSDVHTKEIE